jgi:hypothetical protein
MAIENIDRSKLAELTRHGGYLEYSKASNPIASGATPQVPLLQFPAALHAGGGSRVIPLDTSDQLACAGPASSPGLLASFGQVTYPCQCDIATVLRDFGQRGERLWTA